MEPSDSETEEAPFHVYRPTTAESQAAKNRPHVTFNDIPEIASDDRMSHRGESLPLYINFPDLSRSNDSPQYEEIPEQEASPNIEEVEASESNSSDQAVASAGRNRRPPVRYGIDDYVTKPK